MTLLVNPDGFTIDATGRLETLLLARGYTPTDQPPAPGVRLVTAAELDAVAARIDSPGLAPRIDNLEGEVEEVIATVSAETGATAPKPTPRTDAIETKLAALTTKLEKLEATVKAIPAVAHLPGR